MGKQSFDDRLAQLEALRAAPEETALTELRKALKDRVNYLVAKAAAIVSERQFRTLIDDLLTAFTRFMRDPVKSDPQCWAKIAIVKALKHMGHSDRAVFLIGIVHIQLEPVWGGREDSAAPLRGACAMALLNSDIPTFDLLLYLTDLLADAETLARTDAARAIGQLSAREGLLPLRLKALLGDVDAEVMGNCFAALLSIASRDCMPFVARFLENGNPDVRVEAAAALADAIESEGIALVKKSWPSQLDREVRKSILGVLAGSPHTEAADFLLSIIESESEEIAIAAIQAISKSRFARPYQERVKQTIADTENSKLMQAFEVSLR